MKNYWQFRWDRDKKLKRVYCFGKNTKDADIISNMSAEIYKMNGFLSSYVFDINSVLDFGCGVGYYSMMFKGFKYTGSDVVPELIAYNNKRFGNERAKFIVLKERDELKEKYDLIYARGVLQHFQDDLLTYWLNEFKKYCKYLVCYTNPGVWDVPIQKENLVSGASCCRRPDELIKILQSNGWITKKHENQASLILAVPGG